MSAYPMDPETSFYQPLNPAIRMKLFNALAEYDRRQSRTKHYNRYALGHYATALAHTAADVKNGATVRQAILVNFTDRLRDTLLKAIGEPIATRDEEWTVRTWPRPDIIDATDDE